MQLLDIPQLANTQSTHNTEFAPLSVPFNDLSADPQKNPSTNWLGLSRQHCIQQLEQSGLTYTHFAQWLAVPELELLLVFKHNACCACHNQITHY